MLSDLVQFIKEMGSDPVTFELPLPPSINKCYRSYGQRTLKSKPYRQWISYADGVYRCAGHPTKQLHGKVFVLLEVYQGPGWNPLRDLDNLLKPVQDWIKNKGLIKEDNSKHVPGCASILLPPEPGQSKAKMVISLIPLERRKPSQTTISN